MIKWEIIHFVICEWIFKSSFSFLESRLGLWLEIEGQSLYNW